MPEQLAVNLPRRAFGQCIDKGDAFRQLVIGEVFSGELQQLRFSDGIGAGLQVDKGVHHLAFELVRLTDDADFKDRRVVIEDLLDLLGGSCWSRRG